MTYLTIDEYIQNSPEHIQYKLNELRDLIRSIVPVETIETMAYAMPTFKWKSNLIHFAHTKHHIGIYPGPAAILKFQDQLTKYKTTKGSIHLPFNEAIPSTLIRNIVGYNIDLLKNKYPQN